MNTEKQKKLITAEEWETRLDQIPISRTQINKLIINYLVSEGFQNAAEQFSKESSTELNLDISLQARNQIRIAIVSGEIDKSIQLINDLDPNLLQEQPGLLFALRLQKLVTYIRENKISEALAYGQEVLVPTAKGNPELLNELEKALSLLAFSDIQESPLAEISSPAYKLKIASDVNAAILKNKGKNQETTSLGQAFKVLEWTQKKLDKTVSFPKIALSEFKL
ncbi:hypothetical protein SteCoe_15357 [Stentor coeruleus]|uniref:CTLH domain-containing protein n=1 Tax=Stentor coeruleus TaxID=5963 RepID=A0A1R2C3V2_9CILI|nr:hypothetical protein SteCoe_15357 [Stentor coeruleus]